MHLFVRRLGVKRLHSVFWCKPALDSLYKEELKLFDHWFSVCNASSAPTNQARAYKRLHKRVRLMREDNTTPSTEMIPAISAAVTWKAAVSNQTKPVVVNGLMAGRALKKSIVDIWGSRAVSLGTVSVESMWWQHHLRNVNRASVWARPEWRQFHAVVAWKKDVMCVLRQCFEASGGSQHTGWMQMVHEVWYSLLPEQRDLVNLPPKRDSLLEGRVGSIDESRVNVGFCDWLGS